MVSILGWAVRSGVTPGAVRSGIIPPPLNMRRLMNLLPTQFLVPSILYAVNNNIYFAGLTLVPPPIWLILCSFRTVVTASLYKVCVCTSL